VVQVSTAQQKMYNFDWLYLGMGGGLVVNSLSDTPVIGHFSPYNFLVPFTIP